MEGTFISYLL